MTDPTESPDAPDDGTPARPQDASNRGVSADTPAEGSDDAPGCGVGAPRR